MVKTAGVKEEVPRRPQGTKPDNNDTNLKIANWNHAWNAWVWQEIHAFTRFSVARQQQKYRYAYKSAGTASLRAAHRPALCRPTGPFCAARRCPAGLATRLVRHRPDTPYSAARSRSKPRCMSAIRSSQCSSPACTRKQGPACGHFVALRTSVGSNGMARLS